MVSIAGNRLDALARACAQELGTFTPTITTGVSTGITNLALGGLADSEAPPERYGGQYAYIASGAYAGQQGRITRGGFVGASGATTLATPINITGAVQVPAGVTVELYGVIPRIDQDGLTSIRTCINRAIRKLWYRHWYPFTGVDGQVEYDLGALWFASRKRFIRLMEPDPGGTGHPPVAAQTWDVIQNGDVWTLQLGTGYGTGETFWLVIEAPLNFRLYLTGAWANQASPTAGMVLDADACLGAWNTVMQASLYECMKALALQAGGDRKAYWVGRVAEQRKVVSAIKLYQMDDDGTGLDGEGPTLGADQWGLDPSKGLFSGRWD